MHVLMDGGRRWRAWRGVNGSIYARLIDSSPPVVVQAPTLAELGRQIFHAQVRLDERIYWPGVLASRREEG